MINKGMINLSNFHFNSSSEINKELKNLLEIKNTLILKDNNNIIFNKDINFYHYNEYKNILSLKNKSYEIINKNIRFKDFKDYCSETLQKNINYEINKFIYDYLSDKFKLIKISLNLSEKIESYHSNYDLYNKELKEYFGLHTNISYYSKIKLFYHLENNQTSFNFEIKRNYLYLTLDRYKKDIEELNKEISYSLEIIEKLKEYFDNLNINISYEIK